MDDELIYLKDVKVTQKKVVCSNKIFFALQNSECYNYMLSTCAENDLLTISHKIGVLHNVCVLNMCEMLDSVGHTRS